MATMMPWVAMGVLAVCGAATVLLRIPAGSEGGRWLLLSWVAAGMALPAAPFIYALRRPEPSHWYAWTIYLGLVAGAVMVLLWIGLTSAGGAAGLLGLGFGAVTVAYCGLAWRSGGMAAWRACSAAYVLAALAMTVAVIAAYGDDEIAVLLVGSAVYGLFVSILMTASYLPAVRWWYRVRRGWTGGRTGQ
jgi:hypothetical protein